MSGIRAHLDRQRNLSNHVTRKRADHTATRDLAVPMSFRAVIEQQFVETFVAAVGNRAA